MFEPRTPIVPAPELRIEETDAYFVPAVVAAPVAPAEELSPLDQMYAYFDAAH